MIKKRNYLYKNKKVLSVLKIIDSIIDIFPKRKRTLPNDIKKILLIKPDHLGDVLLLTSVLPLIKQKYQKATIDVILGSWSKVIIDNNENINDVYIIDHFRLDRSNSNLSTKLWKFIKDYFTNLKKIRKEKYDLCINFRSYGNNLITLQLLSNCRYNIAYGSAGFGGLLDCEVSMYEGKHEVEYFLELLKYINIKKILENLKSQIFIRDIDKLYVSNMIEEYKLENFIIIHPGSGDKQKMKDDTFWKKIISKYDCQIVFCGTSNEKYLIKNINTLNTINLIGKFNIAQLVEFYKKANLIYTVDSLAGHIASLVNTKTISFYSDFTDTKRWKPLGDNTTVIKNHTKYLEELK